MRCSECGDYTPINYSDLEIILCLDCSEAADEYYENQFDKNYPSDEFLDNQTDASGITICDSDPGL